MVKLFILIKFFDVLVRVARRISQFGALCGRKTKRERGFYVTCNLNGHRPDRIRALVNAPCLRIDAMRHSLTQAPSSERWG